MGHGRLCATRVKCQQHVAHRFVLMVVPQSVPYGQLMQWKYHIHTIPDPAQTRPLPLPRAATASVHHALASGAMHGGMRTRLWS